MNAKEVGQVEQKKPSRALTGKVVSNKMEKTIAVEIEGVDEATAREAFRLASAKLSVATMFVKRQVR